MIDYNATDDFAQSINAAYDAVRERVRNGGKPWNPKLNFTLVRSSDGSGVKSEATTVGPAKVESRSERREGRQLNGGKFGK